MDTRKAKTPGENQLSVDVGSAVNKGFHGSSGSTWDEQNYGDNHTGVAF